MRRSFVLATASLLLACRPVEATAPAAVDPAPESTPESELAPEATPEPESEPKLESEPEPEPEQPAPYELAWTTELDDWTRGAAISGAGDPLFIASRAIYLLARHDGTILEQAQLACSAAGPLRFINEDTAIIACREGIREIGLPGLTVRRAFDLPAPTHDDRIVATDIRASALAYGTGGGSVVVLTRQANSYVPSFEVERDAELESLALSPNADVLLVGWQPRNANANELSTIEAFDLSSGSSVATLPVTGRTRITAMSFSPDASMVFAHAGSFEAGIIEVASMTWLRSYSVGSWVSESVWVRPDLVAGAGSDGISLFPVNGGNTLVLEVPGLQYPTMESVGASFDGSMFCTGERDGTVACWSNRALEPSTYKARAPLVR